MRGPARAAAGWLRSFLATLFLLWPAALFARPLTVGLIGEEPVEDIRKTLPFASYLAKRLEEHGISDGKVIVVESIAEMAALLRAGKADLHVHSYARTVALNRLTKSKALARRWKKGSAEYHGVLFARHESGITRLEEFRGKTIGLEEHFSAVGHLLPKFMLAEKGLQLVPAGAPRPPNGVGYIFANHDENTMLWVVRGKVAAGAMDSQNYAQLSKKYDRSLTVVAKTPSVPRHLVSARAGLPQKLQARIKEILLQMDQTEEGRNALRQFERTARFDELSEQNAALMQKMGELVESELKLQ
ncbi:MAG TPA: phosphate/phosphite/phosphonate ABC transporter substrate-binding protein [Candidatus Acidoferrales bacterium]|nr:phosphate/phosphite/phosphonate ABC transporter substrate-binding protein [Candidatus Acidoferrales bacterium]